MVDRIPFPARLAVLLALAWFPLPGGPVRAAGRDDALKALAGRIDYHVEADWKQHDVKPTPPADDPTFLRRVCLDLAGKVPSLTEVRDFLDDPDPDKRRRLVRRLLATEDYARHTATVWGRQLFPPNPNIGFDPAATTWLRQQIKDGTGYDRIVRELLTADVRGSAGAGNAANLFVNANQARAETVAAAVGRDFLGVKLECAQCHNHPFAAWKREQFWQLAAFFSALRDPQGRPVSKEPGREITIPNTDKVVRARFPDGSAPEFKEGADGRMVLADWIVGRDNPYFARAAVNRVWARYLGTGLVDPHDDMRPENPPSHPELLDALARAFIDSGFDERFVAEAILTSKTYQLSSVATDPSQEEPRRFGRAAVRGLTAEQVYDSLAEVTGHSPQPNRRNQDFNGRRAEFVARFATPDRPTEAQTPVLQALHVMNGRLVSDATRPENNRWLRVLAESADAHPGRCVEELYLTVLVRPPTEAERERFVNYVRGGGPHKDPKRAVADVFWVLLNSTEFVLNH
jgi:hypothetical protein